MSRDNSTVGTLLIVYFAKQDAWASIDGIIRHCVMAKPFKSNYVKLKRKIGFWKARGNELNRSPARSAARKGSDYEFCQMLQRVQRREVFSPALAC